MIEIAALHLDYTHFNERPEGLAPIGLTLDLTSRHWSASTYQIRALMRIEGKGSTPESHAIGYRTRLLPGFQTVLLPFYVRLTDRQIHQLENRSNLFCYVDVELAPVFRFWRKTWATFIYNPWSKPRPKDTPTFVLAGGFVDPQGTDKSRL